MFKDVYVSLLFFIKTLDLLKVGTILTSSPFLNYTQLSYPKSNKLNFWTLFCCLQLFFRLIYLENLTEQSEVFFYFVGIGLEDIQITKYRVCEVKIIPDFKLPQTCLSNICIRNYLPRNGTEIQLFHRVLLLLHVHLRVNCFQFPLEILSILGTIYLKKANI